jgi:hypothetical protein
MSKEAENLVAKGLAVSTMLNVLQDRKEGKKHDELKFGLDPEPIPEPKSASPFLKRQKTLTTKVDLRTFTMTCVKQLSKIFNDKWTAH